MAVEPPYGGAVLYGGQGGPAVSRMSIASQRPAAATQVGGAAAGPWAWPSWAREQLDAAVALAAEVPDRMSVAGLLYRDWFNPVAGPAPTPDAGRPLAGLYRSAHAGSARRHQLDGWPVVRRHDVIRADRWWRTWGARWTPPRTRPGSVRLMLTPRADRLADFVATVTGHLLDDPRPWSLACATEPRRIARYGSAVLDLAGLDAVPPGLLADLAPVLRPVIPPLCLPLAPGVGGAEYPDNGMTFGEHRCHLVALALRHPVSERDPLRAIAAVFAAHGLDPAHPHRAR